jgi:hypothetical protein
VGYDERLAERVRRMMVDQPALAERRMFGGLAFLLGGRMCCGIVGEDLVVRVGPERYAAALALPHARPMDFTGRALKGMVYVSPAGFATDDDLADWLASGLRFARTLPAKPA